MSRKSSFKEQLEPWDDPKVEFLAPSSSPADVRVQMNDDFPSPVSFALLLRDSGLSLMEAHSAATKLAADGSITITLRPRSLRDVLGRLEALGLTAHAVRDTGRYRVLMPADLLPPDISVSGTRSVSALHERLSKMTVGDLRRIYGKAFARNYKSSAKLSDVLYSMDPAALETIAADTFEG